MRTATGLPVLSIGVAAVVLTFVAKPDWAWFPMLVSFAAIVLGVVQASRSGGVSAKRAACGAALGFISLIILAWWFGGWMR